MSTNENWKPVVGYEGFYSVSDIGRVRRDKSTTRTKAGKILKLTLSRKYLNVGLSRPEIRPKCFRVHRLVWEAFRYQIPPNLVINHLDGAPENNRLENLECVTCAENVRHAFRVLGRSRGGSAKVSEADVIEIRTLRASGKTLKSIGETYNVTIVCVSSICSGKTWAHIGGPITKPKSMKALPRDVVDRCGPDVVEAVKRRYKEGDSPTKMAAEFDVSKRTILNWCQGKTRS